MDGKCNVTEATKWLVCLKHREACHQWNTWFLDCNNFPNETKATFQGGLEAVFGPSIKAFVVGYLGTSQSGTRTPELWVSHLLWKHKGKVYPDSGVWWWGQPPALPDSSARSSLTHQRGSSKINWWMCCPGCLTQDGQIWWLSSQLCQQSLLTHSVKDSPWLSPSITRSSLSYWLTLEVSETTFKDSVRWWGVFEKEKSSLEF